MNIKVNQDNTRIESLSSDKIVDIIYQNIKNNDIHDSSKLSGFVQINHGWDDLIDFFTSIPKKYPDFTCMNILDPYVRFEDPIVEQYIINKLRNSNIGDGVGLIQANLDKVSDYRYFTGLSGNTEITSFNELNKTKLTMLAGSTFKNCINLRKINLSNINNLQGDAFNGCTSLTDVVDGSNLLSIGDRAFYNCNQLKTIQNLPKKITLGFYVFEKCENFEGINGILDLSETDLLGSTGQFNTCKKLKKIILGSVVGFGGRWNGFDNGRKIFYGCTNLHTVEVQELQGVSAGWFGFGNTPNIKNIVIKSTTIPTIDSEINDVNMNYFGGTGVKIYVPDEVVNDWKALSSNIESYIYPLSEYVPIED